MQNERNIRYFETWASLQCSYLSQDHSKVSMDAMKFKPTATMLYLEHT